jgi:hypothetical protein
MKSFLFDFTNGFTNWAGINFTSWPCSRKARPRKCDPEQASIPDQAGLHVRGEGNRLLLGKLLLQQHLAVIAKGHQVKGRLAKVNTNRSNLHVDDPPSICLQDLPEKIKRRTILVIAVFRATRLSAWSSPSERASASPTIHQELHKAPDSGLNECIALLSLVEIS